MAEKKIKEVTKEAKAQANVELTDEALDQVNSGVGDSFFEPIVPYEIGQRVRLKGDEGEIDGTVIGVFIKNEYMVDYEVRFDNGKSYRVFHNILTKI